MTGRGALVAVTLAALAGGCGTVHNCRRPTLPPADAPGADVCRAYGGVRGDWDAITDYPWRTTPSWLDYVVVPALAATDLGFTAFGDTITLPYTAVAEVRRALAGPGATSAPPPRPAERVDVAPVPPGPAVPPPLPAAGVPGPG